MSKYSHTQFLFVHPIQAHASNLNMSLTITTTNTKKMIKDPQKVQTVPASFGVRPDLSHERRFMFHRLTNHATSLIRLNLSPNTFTPKNDPASPFSIDRLLMLPKKQKIMEHPPSPPPKPNQNGLNENSRGQEKKSKAGAVKNELQRIWGGGG